MQTCETPRLRRRIMCMIYESLLVLGVVVVPVTLVTVLCKSLPLATTSHIQQIVTFLVVGAYFVYCWTWHNNQTLAMKTWRIRLVMADYTPIRWQHAVIRYLLAWMWFLPALLCAYFLKLKPAMDIAALGIGMVLWSLTIFLDKDRQFLHDRWAGTRLILRPLASKPTPPPAA